MARPDGRPPLASDVSAGVDRKLLEAALLATDDAANRRIAAIALPAKLAGTIAKRTNRTADLPPAALHSEENSLAVLRRGWKADDERLVVRFAGQDCEIELIASGRVAVSGEWHAEVFRQDQPLAPVSDWESICWHSDADVDYLELQIDLAEDVILQRHLILAREDRFLLLADAILGPHGGGLEYFGSVPLAAGVKFRPAAETREGALVGAKGGKQRASDADTTGRSIAQVLPLALPEWRTDARGGELATSGRGLELRHTTAGQRLFAPLFIDLDPARFRRRLTWRTLSVAESLLPVPTDRAVGYRVAIGKQQWLIYRSLAAQGNRTLLGHNLSTETLVARFGEDGEIAPIIEIE